MNVDLHLGGYGEEFSEHTVAVVAYNLNANNIVLVEPDVPAHLNHTRKLCIVEHIRTVRAVHGYAAPARDVPRDGIAGDRVAAACKTHEIAALALDEDAVTRLLALAATRCLEFGEHLRDLGWRAVLDRLLVKLNELRHDTAQRDTTVTKCS